MFVIVDDYIAKIPNLTEQRIVEELTVTECKEISLKFDMQE